MKKTERQKRSNHLAMMVPASMTGHRSVEKVLRRIAVVDESVRRLERASLQIVKDPDVSAATKNKLAVLASERTVLVQRLVDIAADPDMIEMASRPMLIGNRPTTDEKAQRRLRALRGNRPPASRYGDQAKADTLIRQIEEAGATATRLEHQLLLIDRDPDLHAATTATLKTVKRRRARLVRSLVELGAGIPPLGEQISAEKSDWWPDDGEDEDSDDEAAFESQARAALGGILSGAGIDPDESLSARQAVELVAASLASTLATSAANATLGGRLDAMQRQFDERLADVEQQVRRAAADKALPGYAGVWKAARTYLPGEYVTHQGSLWHSDIETKAVRPGDGAVWKLAVKRGAAGQIEGTEL